MRNRKERINNIINYFSTQQPTTTTELKYRNVFELLCAVVLSAQCTDKRVNTVTPHLFASFPTPKDMAEATPEEIARIIASISYPNMKAKHLVSLAKEITQKHEGTVPESFNELISLPGVGRKTANVMLAVAFQQPAMPVDTHVFRVSHRLGIVPRNADTPQKVEHALVKQIPQSMLADAHHWILLHGRYVCTARNPQCNTCNIAEWCDKRGLTDKK